MYAVAPLKATVNRPAPLRCRDMLASVSRAGRASVTQPIAGSVRYADTDADAPEIPGPASVSGVCKSLIVSKWEVPHNPRIIPCNSY